MYDIKALYEAESVENAVQLLTEHPEAVIIAGGSDVLIKMREGKLAGCELVSIYGLDGRNNPYSSAYKLFTYNKKSDNTEIYKCSRRGC